MASRDSIQSLPTAYLFVKIFIALMLNLKPAVEILDSYTHVQNIIFDFGLEYQFKNFKYFHE